MQKRKVKITFRKKPPESADFKAQKAEKKGMEFKFTFKKKNQTA